MTAQKIVIEVKGGVVVDVSVDPLTLVEVEVLVIDRDAEEVGEPAERTWILG